MVPRKDRPIPESLEGYERRHSFDPDYTNYRLQLGDWLHDYRRDQEETSNRDNGRTPLEGHNDDMAGAIDGGRVGFDPDNFDLDRVVRSVGSAPRH